MVRTRRGKMTYQEMDNIYKKIKELVEGFYRANYDKISAFVTRGNRYILLNAELGIQELKKTNRDDYFVFFIKFFTNESNIFEIQVIPFYSKIVPEGGSTMLTDVEIKDRALFKDCCNILWAHVTTMCSMDFDALLEREKFFRRNAQ